MSKKKVAILFGGPSSEHEVSLRSAENVLAHVDRERYEVLPVPIGRDGCCEIGGAQLEPPAAVAALAAADVDVVFPVLHGAFGEDGQLQALLERAGLSFVGSGAAASRLAMDKARAAEALERAGLQVPRGVVLGLGDPAPDLRFPVIVKPVDEGSSVGLSRFESAGEYESGRGAAFGGRGRMLVQELVSGRELTCAVVEVDGLPLALPPSEVILTAGPLFDYDAKYVAGACREITPAPLDEETTRRVQAAAIRAHEALGCRSVSRTDVILGGAGELWVLEINTIPGLTPTSFLPEQAKVAGITLPQLVTLLVESAGR